MAIVYELRVPLCVRPRRRALIGEGLLLVDAGAFGISICRYSSQSEAKPVKYTEGNEPRIISTTVRVRLIQAPEVHANKCTCSA